MIQARIGAAIPKHSRAPGRDPRSSPGRNRPAECAGDILPSARHRCNCDHNLPAGMRSSPPTRTTCWCRHGDILPFGFAQEPVCLSGLARKPSHVVLGVVPGHVDDRLLAAAPALVGTGGPFDSVGGLPPATSAPATTAPASAMEEQACKSQGFTWRDIGSESYCKHTAVVGPPVTPVMPPSDPTSTDADVVPDTGGATYRGWPRVWPSDGWPVDEQGVAHPPRSAAATGANRFHRAARHR
jgi:hypothetical protein